MLLRRNATVTVCDVQMVQMKIALHAGGEFPYSRKAGLCLHLYFHEARLHGLIQVKSALLWFSDDCKPALKYC